MAQTMSILQIGGTDWTNQVADYPLDWTYCQNIDLPVLLARQKSPSDLTFNYVLLTDSILDSGVLARQIQEWPAYRVLYLGELQDFAPAVQAALIKRRAFSLNEQTAESVAEKILRDFYQGQAGFATRFSENQFLPENNYAWHWRRAGRFETTVTGDFGENFQQIGTLKTFPGDFQPSQENLLYADYSTTGNVELALSFVFFQNGGLQQLKLFQNPDAKNLPMVRAPKDYQDYQIMVLAKGNGSLTLRNLHQRKSRHGVGYFIPGGERLLTADGQEIHSYFNPGCRKGPLVVAFAGTRLHVEGFEMMGPLNELGYPYLLFTDTRAQGGAFMVGSEEFEQLVMARIAEAELQLGQEAENTIFTGYSMGSYPAMYYAGKKKGRHLAIAKPIINLGSFTAKGNFAHQGINHDWPIDIRQVLTGRLDERDTGRLNQKLWSALDQLNWAKTQIDLYTMQQDEYDGESLPQFLDYLEEKQAKVHHVKVPGRHEDKIAVMIDFLQKSIDKQAQQQMGGLR